MSIKDKYSVSSISVQDCKPWLLQKHYLRRMTSISFAYGLFRNSKELVGVCTFGNAIPLTMKKSICGEAFMDIVYELNRLCTLDSLEKNCNSYFLGEVFKQLPKPMIIVSYADKSVGHNGYIYQATNFMFTGESHTQMDWKLEGMEHLHSRTLMDEFAFEPDRVKKLKAKYGDRLYQVQRPPKHRYVLFLGDKRRKHQMMCHKRFDIKQYPKGDNKRYEADAQIITQSALF
jgi:hypothetical protein